MTTATNFRGDTVTVNDSGIPQTVGASVAPRAYAQHSRHGRFARVRYAKQFVAFLTGNGTKFSAAVSAVFADLKKNTAERLKKSADGRDLT